MKIILCSGRYVEVTTIARPCPVCGNAIAALERDLEVELSPRTAAVLALGEYCLSLYAVQSKWPGWEGSITKLHHLNDLPFAAAIAADKAAV